MEETEFGQEKDKTDAMLWLVSKAIFNLGFNINIYNVISIVPSHSTFNNAFIFIDVIQN